MIINRTLQKIVNLIHDFFGVREIEFGRLFVNSSQNEQEIFVSTKRDTVAVWFNMSPITPPVCGGSMCFISEAVPVPGGFVFMVNVNSECLIRWIALVE